MTIVILGKELVQKSSVSELRRSEMKCRDTQHRIAEMPKPDLKEMSIKASNGADKLEYDRKVTVLSHS
jgi:hypothetical protein